MNSHEYTSCIPIRMFENKRTLLLTRRDQCGSDR